MKALDRKLIRDLVHMKTQVLAISLVMASGIATFVLSLSTITSIEASRATYYERYRFAQIFAHLKRAPNTLAERIAAIPGVARVQTRVVEDVNLDVPGMADPAVGRLISVPEINSPGLNELHLRAGRQVEPGRPGEVLAGEAFTEAHGLKPGDSISAIINGRKENLKIVGIVISPEFIYQIREGELVPDARRYGVLWMSYEEIARAFDMDGAFNDVALALMPGASEREVMKRLDDITAPYGALGAYTREDQTSHKFTSNEIKQLRGMALIAPLIFLSVASFLLNVVLSRLVGTQREQIATLKAFGYTRSEIGLHYLKLILLIVIIGSLLGCAAGTWLGRNLTGIYAQYFRFPEFGFQLDFKVVMLALLLSSGAAVLGTLGALRRAMSLPPAEAMRPEPPASFRPTLIEKMGLQRFFAQTTRMILRQLERQPVKSLLTSLGIALAVAVMILGSFTRDAVDYVIDFQFYRSERYDMNIVFVENTNARVLHEIRNLPGVLECEAFRSVPVRLRAGHRERRLGVLGLEPDGRLFHLLDAKERLVPLPQDGLLISQKLAELLGVRVGDPVTLEVMEGVRPVREATVTGMINDFAGTAAYMEIGALQKLMWEGDVVSGAFVRAEPDRLEELYSKLKSTPRIASVTLKKAGMLGFKDTIERQLGIMRLFNIVFATIIAFGVVYNSARISFSERSRELATLRVIGFTRGEISAILLGELGVLTFVAIPLGLLAGHAFCEVAVRALETETQRFPLVIYARTYAFAVLVVLMAALLSGLVVRRGLDQLDLVAVLKSKE